MQISIVNIKKVKKINNSIGLDTAAHVAALNDQL